MAITKFPLTDFVLEMSRCAAVKAVDTMVPEEEPIKAENLVQEVVSSVRNHGPAVSIVNSDDFIKYSKEEVEALKAEAKSEGFELAKQEYENEQHKVQEKNFILLSAIKDKITDIKDEVATSYNSMIEDFGELFGLLLRKVVGRIVERFSHDLVMDFLRKNMHKVCAEPTINIKVSAKDYEAISGYMNEIEKMCDSGVKIAIFTKDDISQGDCIVDFERGSISQNINSLLSELDAVLNSYFPKLNNT